MPRQLSDCLLTCPLEDNLVIIRRSSFDHQLKFTFSGYLHMGGQMVYLQLLGLINKPSAATYGTLVLERLARPMAHRTWNLHLYIETRGKFLNAMSLAATMTCYKSL